MAPEPGVGRTSADMKRLAHMVGAATDMLCIISWLAVIPFVIFFFEKINNKCQKKIAYRTDCLAATEAEVINLEEKRSYFDTIKSYLKKTRF